MNSTDPQRIHMHILRKGNFNHAEEELEEMPDDSGSSSDSSSSSWSGSGVESDSGDGQDLEAHAFVDGAGRQEQPAVDDLM